MKWRKIVKQEDVFLKCLWMEHIFASLMIQQDAIPIKLIIILNLFDLKHMLMLWTCYLPGIFLVCNIILQYLQVVYILDCFCDSSFNHRLHHVYCYTEHTMRAIVPLVNITLASSIWWNSQRWMKVKSEDIDARCDQRLMTKPG